MFWLIVVIALWGIVHSLLASLGFKDFLRSVLGDGPMRFYRLFYNLFAVISFLPVIYLMVSCGYDMTSMLRGLTHLPSQRAEWEPGAFEDLKLSDEVVKKIGKKARRSKHQPSKYRT